jgi:RecJ-like exonuclease
MGTVLIGACISLLGLVVASVAIGTSVYVARKIAMTSHDVHVHKHGGTHTAHCVCPRCGGLGGQHEPACECPQCGGRGGSHKTRCNCRSCGFVAGDHHPECLCPVCGAEG